MNRETTYTYQSPDPVTPGLTHQFYRNYVTEPGAMIVPDLPQQGADEYKTQNKLSRIIPLSSGVPTPNTTYNDRVFEAPELNVPIFDEDPNAAGSGKSLAKQHHLLTDVPAQDENGNDLEVPKMKVKWVYLRQNKGGSKNPATWTLDSQEDDRDNPKIDPNNPIIGRYAYWADDESTKINYNLAWKKSSSTSGGNANTLITAHPSKIDLRALSLTGHPAFTEQMGDLVHFWTSKQDTNSPGRYFNSFADARQLDPGVSELLELNKFDLTHFNHDPDTTFFGEDRILLTTNPKLVPRNPDGTYARKFLDIMREDLGDSPDPGLTLNIAGGQVEVPNSGSNKYPGISITNKLDFTVKTLVRYMSEANWPIADPGTNFRNKYYQGSTIADAKLANIAVNILDYVRSRESTAPLVQFERFGFNTRGEYTLNYADVGAKDTAYQGVARGLYITELGMLIEKTATRIPPNGVPGWPTYTDAAGKKGPRPLYKCFFVGEIHLPTRYNVGPDGINLVPDSDAHPKKQGWLFNFTEVRDTSTAFYYRVHEDGTMTHMDPGTDPYGGTGCDNNTTRIYAEEVSINGAAAGTNTIMHPGDYAVVTKVFYRDTSPNPPVNGIDPQTGVADSKAPYVNLTSMRGGLSYGSSTSRGLSTNSGASTGFNVQIVPQASSVTYTCSLSPDYSLKTMSSTETDDPRCNSAKIDWKQVGTNTFNVGAKTPDPLNNRNSRWSAGTTRGTVVGNAYQPQQDRDRVGRISDYSMYMPAPKVANSSDPENGKVTSVGELGYINTGVNAHDGSTPWRSLRLQPSTRQNSKGPSTELPDWALMDLFTVPNTSKDQSDLKKGSFIYTPHSTAVAGRVNINSHVVPFTDVNRTRALVGVFLNANDPVKSAFNTTTGKSPNPVPYTQAQAETIAKNIFNRKLAGQSTDGSSGQKFGYPDGFDTPGEVLEIAGVADQGEQSEDLVRQVSSLLCTRGGVLSVYSIGQAIKQTPTGKLVVTAEQRQQSVVERYVVNRGTPDVKDDEVRFKVVYTRNLTP